MIVTETNGSTVGSVMIVGGGIGGVQAALDLADSGYKVYLVEEKSSIGGLMAQLDKTFPTNDCSMCILAPKLVDAGSHPNIEILTNAELVDLQGEAGRFSVTIHTRARFVDAEKCTGCGRCTAACMVHNVPQIIEMTPAAAALEAEDRSRIDELFALYGTQPSSLIPILQAVNDAHFYLPRDVMAYVAERLGVPLSRVYHVATFYTAFRLEPRGRHLIKVCLGTACHVRGAGRVLDELQRLLGVGPGDTTADRLFTLETVNCLGACAMGPVVMVNDEFHSMSPEQVGPMIERLAKPAEVTA